jgi:hypothetical protein
MKRNPKLLVVVLAAAAIVAGLVFFWTRSRQPGPVSAGGVSPVPAAEIGVGSSLEPPTLSNRLPPKVAVITEPSIESGLESVQVVPVPPRAEWEDKLSKLIAADIPDHQKAHELLAMLPTLNPEAQQEVLQHSLNLLSDDDFGVVEPILTNARTSEVLLELLLTDLFNRPNRIKLPLCLALAAAEDHPLRDEASTVLQLFVDEDYGTNWSAWSEAIAARLKQEEEPE